MKKKLLVLTVIFMSFMVFANLVFASQEKPFEGTKLIMGSVQNVPTDHAITLLDEFYEETGITVEIEQMKADQLHDKITIESIGKTGYYDLMRTSPTWNGKFSEAGWIIPLDKFVESTKYEIDDFIESAIESLGMLPWDSQLWGIPWDVNVLMLAYRKDLFGDPEERMAFREKYGYALNPPQTTDEWLDVAEFFTRDTNNDGKNDLFGTGFGQMYPGPSGYYSYVLAWTFGGELLDEVTMESKYDDPNIIEALKWGKELNKFMPGGVLSWATYDSFGPMANGSLATSLNFFTYATSLLDPEQSEMFDKIGFTTVPAYLENGKGYITGKAPYSGSSIAIHADSKNKEAAWEFLSWLLGKEKALDLAKMGTITPRKSILSSSEVMQIKPEYNTILPALKWSLSYVAKSRPRVGIAQEIDALCGLNWNEVVLGDISAEDAVKKVNKGIEEAIKKGQ